MIFIIYTLTLFSIGFLGFCITKKNLLFLLIFIELMLLSLNIFFVIISVYENNLIGELVALFVLNIAAAESSIGLALVLLYYRLVKSINIDYITLLKG
jgi:NADH-quinone oxidoreductase subunit K